MAINHSQPFGGPLGEGGLVCLGWCLVARICDLSKVGSDLLMFQKLFANCHEQVISVNLKRVSDGDI